MPRHKLGKVFVEIRMTIGIYALNFSGYDKEYIGLSINVEARFKAHCYLLLNNKHYNYKLQNAYHKYGLPVQSLLEELNNPDDLNAREIFWINNRDTFNNGLNLTTGGMTSYGETHPNSKYTNSQIINAFLHIARREDRLLKISQLYSIHLDVIKAISNGYAHSWLRSIFPSEYAYMIATKHTDIQGEKHPASIYPKDKILQVFFQLVKREVSLKNIADSFGVAYSTVANIACGLSHKWLQAEYPQEYSSMLAKVGTLNYREYPPLTNGTDVVYIDNASEFCRIHNLQLPNLSKVINGTRKTHKGWRLYHG